MNPINKGARCFCGARIVAYKCAICGEYFYMCSDAGDSCPGDYRNMDCSCGGDGQHCRK